MFFDYQLQKRVKLDMESIAFVHHSSGLPGTSFTTRGDMTLRQHSPLGIRDSFSHLYSDDRIVDKISRSLQTGDSNVEKILEIYAGRAFATDYVERFPIWTRAVKMEPSVDDSFNFTFVLDIPHQDVVFVPTLADELKEVWIRYLSIMVISAFFVRKICSFVYFCQM